MKKIRLGSGSAFWGDTLEPAIELVEKGDIDYIGFDHLAELTLAILQRIKAKDPTKGYIPDIVPFMKAILPTCARKGIKIITNAGGANPEAAGEVVIAMAREMGLRGLKVGVVVGDDIAHRLDEIRAQGVRLKNLDTGEEDIDRISDRIVAANAYIGSESIIEALRQGADVVVTGRNTDNSLYVAPMVYEFGWKWPGDDWERVGAAVIIGHIIECAGCCTGGMSNLWDVSPEPWNIGFPIAEVYENGEAIITKAPGTGGLVNQWTIKEHLVYEVHDPKNYLMADGIGDLTNIGLEEIGKDRVKVTGMTGKPWPDTLKVCIGYDDGWIGEGEITFPWPDALGKARKAEDILRERFKMVNLDTQEMRIDFIGINSIHGPLAPEPKCDEPNEVRIRVAARTKTRNEAEKVRREVTHLWCMGPVGTTAVISPPPPRPVISLWPTLVPRQMIPTTAIVKEVS